MLLGSLLRFREVMSFGNAVRLVRNKHKPREITINLSSIGREIVLRGRTTDIACFEKIFLRDEYGTPFEKGTPPKFIIDGGANIGMATVYYASRYPSAKVFAVEPERDNFKMLTRNCAGLKNVILKRAALWPTKGKLGLKNSTNDAWAFLVEKPPASRNYEEIEAITIEQILNELGASKIDILKLDIEGSEKELFENCDNWLSNIGEIAIELHDRIKPGCAAAFYRAIARIDFRHEIKGENIFVSL